MSESHNMDHQLHSVIPLQQVNDNDSAAVKNSSPLVSQRYHTARQGASHQSNIQHQYGQPIQRFVLQQGEELQDHTSIQIQELGQFRQGISGDLAQQVTSRTVTPCLLSDIYDRSGAMQTQVTATVGNAGVQVKQEPVAHENDNYNEHDVQDLFDEFTNGSFHDDDAPNSAQTQKAPNPSDHTSLNAPSVKQDPDSEIRLCVDKSPRVKTVGSPIATGCSTPQIPAVMAKQTPETPTVALPQVILDPDVSNSRVCSEPAYLQSRASASHADIVQKQHSFERYTPAAELSTMCTQTQPDSDPNVQFPPVDSITGVQRHGSVHTASSSAVIDPSVNSQLLAQEWLHRRKYFDTSGSTADVVNADPILLYGPRPTQDQSNSQLISATRPPQGLSSVQSTPVYWQQRIPTTSHDMVPQHSDYPQASRYDKPQAPGTTPARGLSSTPLVSPFSHSTTQSIINQSSVGPRLIADVNVKDTSEVSDDDEPLATRVPRHDSTTASLTLGSSQLSVNSNSKSVAPSATAATKLHVSDTKQDSIIELSDNEDEATAEPISWKLPDFEVTYHPPATANDLPLAKVSILGGSTNLVRAEVALTEDHAQQEMELFLNVFLPAQQALKTPDPEPAHAVINFHTISVMVLEAFVQYEIGDEMGRGYGFHGGNIDNQALRPKSSASDNEPARRYSAKDADVDEIFLAVIDRWRAGVISGKGTSKLIRGCQEFCDIALDVVHYVKEHGLSPQGPKRRKERSDKGVKRGARGSAQETEAKGKTASKRKFGADKGNTSAKKSKVNDLQPRKKAKKEPKKSPAKRKTSPHVTVFKK